MAQAVKILPRGRQVNIMASDTQAMQGAYRRLYASPGLNELRRQYEHGKYSVNISKPYKLRLMIGHLLKVFWDDWPCH